MSFYVTLPSNSSKEFYPENTLTNFTTKLQPPFYLTQNYEVGIVEVMFPFNWFNPDFEPILFNKLDGNMKVTNSRFFQNKWPFFDTADALEEKINAFCKANLIGAFFLFDNQSKLWTIKLDRTTQIDFNGHEEFFGFKDRVLDFKLETDKTKKDTYFAGEEERSFNFNKINNLFIYSDIVQFQNVGDTFAPLLRTIPITGKNEAFKHLHYIYNTPQYIPVSRSNIDSIEIDIKDDLGNKIPFSSEGKVIL